MLHRRSQNYRVPIVLAAMFLCAGEVHAGVIRYEFAATLRKSQVADPLNLDGASFRAVYLYDDSAPPIAMGSAGTEPLTSEFATLSATLYFTNRANAASDVVFDTRFDEFRTTNLISNRLKVFNLFSAGTNDVFEVRNVVAAGSIFGVSEEVAIGSIGVRFKANDIIPGSDFPESLPQFVSRDVDDVIFTNTFLDMLNQDRTGRYTLVDAVASEPNVVPEPTSFAIIGIGAIGMLRTRRRRSR